MNFTQPRSFIGMLCIFVNTMISLPNSGTAQSPTDAVMMEGKRICVAAMFNQDKWDEYWEGTLLRNNGNIGELTRNTYNLMAAVGITEKINFLFNVPYVTTEPSGGQFKGAKGLQDLGLWAKAELFKKELGPGTFTTLGVLGLSFPISNYLPDYAPFNLGLGCTEGQARLMLQYLFDFGTYVRVSGAYFKRGTSTIERNYYYDTHGNYTNKVDVPNANHSLFTVGQWLFNRSLKLDVSYEIFNTIGGFDIRRQDAGFISNNMEVSSIQAQVQYFIPKTNGFGVIANYGQVLEGRNVGKSTSFMGGILYQFGICKSKNVQQ